MPVVLEADAEELDWPVDDAEALVEDEGGGEDDDGFADGVGVAEGVGFALEVGGGAVLDGLAGGGDGVAARMENMNDGRDKNSPRLTTNGAGRGY